MRGAIVNKIFVCPRLRDPEQVHAIYDKVFLAISVVSIPRVGVFDLRLRRVALNLNVSQLNASQLQFSFVRPRKEATYQNGID